MPFVKIRPPCGLLPLKPLNDTSVVKSPLVVIEKTVPQLEKLPPPDVVPNNTPLLSCTSPPHGLAPSPELNICSVVIAPSGLIRKTVPLLR